MVRKGVDLSKRKKEKRNMAKDENCVVCGRAPRREGRPNGCPGNCEVPEPIQEEALVEEELVEVKEVEEKAEEAGEEEDFEAYLEGLPVKELKKLCKKADLDTKGRKADLVARLIE